MTPQPGNVNRGAAEHASSPGEATPQQSRSNNVSGSGDSKAEPAAEQQRKSSGKQDAEFAVADGQIGVVQPLEVSHHDAAMSVMQVERIDVNLFRVTVADDTVHVLDREMLRTLPQGMAKLATLEVRERFPPKAKAKSEPQRGPTEAPIEDIEEHSGAEDHACEPQDASGTDATARSAEEIGAAEHLTEGPGRVAPAQLKARPTSKPKRGAT